MALLDDMKQLVTEGVHSDITCCILEASPDDKMVKVEYEDMREKYLKEWLKVAMPLSYGLCDDKGKNYKALVSDAYCSTPPTRPPQAPQKAWAHTPGPPISSATKSLDHAPLDHRFYSSFFPIVLYPIRLAD